MREEQVVTRSRVKVNRCMRDRKRAETITFTRNRRVYRPVSRAKRFSADEDAKVAGLNGPASPSDSETLSTVIIHSLTSHARIYSNTNAPSRVS